MKIICDKLQLLDIINTVQKAVSAKSTLPVLECIKIDAHADGRIVMTGNNLELCIEYGGVCTVSEGGNIAIDSKMFGEIIRRLPDGEVSVEVNEENNITKIVCGKSEFSIQALNAEDFPVVPEINEKYKLYIGQFALKKLIRQTIFAAATNNIRPVQSGVLFEVKDNTITAVAIDTVRLALRKQTVEASDYEFKFIVPGNTLRELLKILKDEDEKIEIMVSDKHCMFNFGYFKVFTRLLEGEFLNYKPILSASNGIEVVVDTKALAESLERASLLINDDASQKTERPPVRLKISYEKMEVNCITGRGRIHDVIPVQLSGDEIEIGFNYKFLLDALRATEEETVKFEMSSPHGSCFIRSLTDEDYVYIVQPVRLYS
ncbi:MAG: DNA polymerase III subunit beta [Clostridia bacterium]|nr:DNA polymerase III subunit beta [Clostridia bacterium]